MNQDEFLEQMTEHMTKSIDDPEPIVCGDAPDAITPYLGWKALRIRPDGQLESPSRSTIWPVKKRLQAACGVQQDYEWQPKRISQARPTPAIVEGPTNPGLTAVTAMVSGTAFFSGGGTYSGHSYRIEPAAEPKVFLPDGFKWSWEPIPHKLVAEDCTCGIYVVANEHNCASYLNADCVLAQVALWGRLAEGTDGARGELAYPQKLYAHPAIIDVAALVADLYGIPIHQMNEHWQRQLAHTYASHQPRMKITIRAKSTTVPSFTSNTTPLLQPGPITAPRGGFPRPLSDEAKTKLGIETVGRKFPKPHPLDVIYAALLLAVAFSVGIWEPVAALSVISAAIIGYAWATIRRYRNAE